jgi:tyrosyl-tRNA synthetase
MYHSTAIAQKTLDEWNLRFSEKRLSETELPRFSARASDAVGIVLAAYSEVFATTKSRTEASRLIKQGSVQLDGEKIVDPKSLLSLRPEQILRLDKTHAVRIG